MPLSIEIAREILESTEEDTFLPNRIFRGLNRISVFDNNMKFMANDDLLLVSDFKKTAIKMNHHDIEQMKKLGWFEFENMWAHEIEKKG